MWRAARIAFAEPELPWELAVLVRVLGGTALWRVEGLRAEVLGFELVDTVTVFLENCPED